MKFALILMLSFGVSSAFAAKCPEGTSMIKSCKSTPVAGDHTVAAEVLDSVALCRKNGETLFVAEKNGQSDVAVATVETRMGGTSYSIFEDDAEFRLSIVTGTRTPVKKAVFSVILKTANMTASSTYTCK